MTTSAPAAPPPSPLPYGAPIPLSRAKQVMTAAERKALEQSWPMVIAIMDSTGHLVLFQKMDQAQLGSVEVAVAKERPQ